VAENLLDSPDDGEETPQLVKAGYVLGPEKSEHFRLTKRQPAVSRLALKANGGVNGL
jgi:hypothetical protein